MAWQNSQRIIVEMLRLLETARDLPGVDRELIGTHESVARSEQYFAFDALCHHLWDEEVPLPREMYQRIEVMVELLGIVPDDSGISNNDDFRSTLRAVAGLKAQVV